MGLVSELYGLSAREAMSLSQDETNFLLEKASIRLQAMAVTSPAMKDIMAPQIAPVLREVRQARAAREAEEDGGGPGAPD